MTVHLTLASESEIVLRLVSDFARGLGCVIDAAEDASSGHLGIELPDAGDTLLELLTHVALSATKAGIDVGEPMCHLTCKHPNVSAEIMLGIRIAEFAIGKVGAPGV